MIGLMHFQGHLELNSVCVRYKKCRASLNTGHTGKIRFLLARELWCIAYIYCWYRRLQYVLCGFEIFQSSFESFFGLVTISISYMFFQFLFENSIISVHTLIAQLFKLFSIITERHRYIKLYPQLQLSSKDNQTNPPVREQLYRFSVRIYASGIFLPCRPTAYLIENATYLAITCDTLVVHCVVAWVSPVYETVIGN